MRFEWRSLRAPALWTIGALASTAAALAQVGDVPQPPDGGLVLVQSEIDYLEAATRRIDVEFENLRPRAAAERIGKVAGLAVDFRGPLPAEPRLSASFEDATVKSVLEWFASKVPVTFKAEKKDRLLVVYHQSEAR